MTDAQGPVSAQEAYYIWDILTAKYHAIERIALWENFAHDAELKAALRLYRSRLQRRTKVYEDFCSRFFIKSSDGPVKSARTSGNTEAITDEQIGLWLLFMNQEHLEMYYTAIRTSSSNDEIRAEMIRGLKWQVNQLDLVIKYLRLKGWISQPPVYPNIPKDVDELVDCGEAYHLWDHLTFTYDRITMGDAGFSVAKDKDLVAIVSTELGATLRRQAQLLEAEVLKFGMPLPKPPAKIHAKLEYTEWLDDDSIFRHLLASEQGAVLAHIHAFKECTTNDRIRGMFARMLTQSVAFADRMVSYGKSKGWLGIPPMYRL